MTKFKARLRTPAQELMVKVRPARRGVRLDLGSQFVYLSAKVARDLADALHDAAEKKVTTDE